MRSGKSSKVIVMTIGNGINVLINFMTLPYLVRSLSFTDYGTYGQVLMIIAILQGLFTFNLNQISNVYFANSNYDHRTVFSTLIRSAFFMSIIGLFVMFISASTISEVFNNPGIKHLLFLSLLNMFGQIITPILISILLFFGKVQQTVAVLVSTNILKVLVMFVAIHYLKSIEALMIGLSVISLIQMIIFLIIIPKEIRELKLFDKKLAGNVFAVASPLALSSIVEKSLVYLDGFMISAMISTSAYAFYRAGAVEVPFIATLYGSVTSIILPEIAKLFSDGNLNEIVRLKRAAISGTVLFVYPVLVFFLFFAAPLVSLYLSKSYMSSIAIFAVFNLSLIIRVNDYQDVIIISRNSKYIFKTVCVISLLNLLMTYILVKNIGIIGGAMSFVLSLSVFAVMLLVKSTKILKCRIVDLFDLSLIAKVASVSVGICTVIFFLNKFYFESVWFIIFSAPVYFIFVFLFGLKFDLIPLSLSYYITQKMKFLKIGQHESRIVK